MVSLLKDRMCEEPPFTYYDVDHFDPFVVQQRTEATWIIVYLSVQWSHPY